MPLTPVRYHVRSVLAAHRRIAGLTPRAGYPLVGSLILVNLGLGVLPVVFIVQTSELLGRIPEVASTAGPDSGLGPLAGVFALAVAAFVAQQVLTPVQTALGELVARRVDGTLFDRLMAASLCSDGIGPLEDQRLLDELGEATRELEHGFQSPGCAVAGQLALIARYGQLLGCLWVVGTGFSGLAAAGVGLTVLLFRRGQRGGLRTYSRVFRTVAGTLRKSEYLRSLAMGAWAAKEIRVFGLIDWLRQGYRETYLEWLRPVWAERRRVYLGRYLWITGAAFVITAIGFAALGWHTGRGLPLTGLALAAQATLVALRLGEYYPEADNQTQFGMDAHDALVRFEDGVRRHASAELAPRSAEPAPRSAEPGALSAPDPRSAEPDALPEPALAPRHAIQFAKVTFGYPGTRRPVYDGLDLTIPAGRCTAIVGVNGAGKTTLVKLLTRLYEPDRGAILVDGTDLRSFSADSWRRRIGIVFQDYTRYEVTAADNIGFGAVEHLDDAAGISAAAAEAGISPVLAGLPRGWQTPLTPHVVGGADLSGGQWQRVALARALFARRHGASILILDEPTASLDVRAETRFFEEFVGLTRGVTTILISHRFSTVRHADHIVVLEQGRVVEQGSHRELVTRDGRYAELFWLQASRFVDDQPAGADSRSRRADLGPVEVAR